MMLVDEGNDEARNGIEFDHGLGLEKMVLATEFHLSGHKGLDLHINPNAASSPQEFSLPSNVLELRLYRFKSCHLDLSKLRFRYYADRERDLEFMCPEYIAGTGGQVRAVIAIKISGARNDYILLLEQLG
ncbi:hypothetical protein Ct61P_15104 [Colletotrichum tofieldiae]|nr:hypothetical protein Ct61P_15104 [Colletotrichum tofieldiae]